MFFVLFVIDCYVFFSYCWLLITSYFFRIVSYLLLVIFSYCWLLIASYFCLIVWLLIASHFVLIAGYWFRFFFCIVGY